MLSVDRSWRRKGIGASTVHFTCVSGVLRARTASQLVQLVIAEMQLRGAHEVGTELPFYLEN